MRIQEGGRLRRAETGSIRPGGPFSQLTPPPRAGLPFRFHRPDQAAAFGLLLAACACHRGMGLRFAVSHCVKPAA